MNYIKKNNKQKNTIVENKKTQYQYNIEQEIEAGLSLLGWEVKSAREKKITINGSYIIFKKNKEAYLTGANFKTSIKEHNFSDIKDSSKRDRKILLKKHELLNIFNKIQCKGYTAIPLMLIWKNSWIKIKIGIAKGKKQHDYRADIKNREWNIKKMRILKLHKY